MALADSALEKATMVATRQKRTTPQTYDYTMANTGITNLMAISMQMYRDLYIENFKNGIENAKNLALSPSAYQIPILTDSQLASKSLISASVFFSAYDTFIKDNQ